MPGILPLLTIAQECRITVIESNDKSSHRSIIGKGARLPLIASLEMNCYNYASFCLNLQGIHFKFFDNCGLFCRILRLNVKCLEMTSAPKEEFSNGRDTFFFLLAGIFPRSTRESKVISIKLYLCVIFTNRLSRKW